MQNLVVTGTVFYCKFTVQGSGVFTQTLNSNDCDLALYTVRYSTVPTTHIQDKGKSIIELPFRTTNNFCSFAVKQAKNYIG